MTFYISLIQKNARALNVILLTFIFLYLEFVFKNVVVLYFERDGYTFAFNLFKYFETKVLYLLLLFLIYIRKPSGFIYGITYLLMIFLLIPNFIIFEFMTEPRWIVYGIVFTLIIMLTLNLGNIIYNIPLISVRSQIIYLILLCILMLIPVIFVYGIHLNFELLFFKNVYKIRAENEGKSDYLTGYFYVWLAKIIFPVIMIYGLMLRKYYLVFISIAGLLYLYLVGAHKSVFLTIFAVSLLYFFNNYKTKIFFLMLSFLSLFIISRWLTIHFDYLLPESIVIRRIFFDPAISNIYYFDFFKNQSLYLSHSILREVIHYPLDTSPERIISNKYFHYPDGSSNNGLISDGFMNFGILGIFFYGFGFALLMKIFESLKITHVFFGVFLIIIYTFISSFFLTTLLTHGVLLFLLISIFLLSNLNKKNIIPS